MEDQPVLVSVTRLRGDGPFSDVKVFADLYQRTWEGVARVIREDGMHASGPVVILRQARVTKDGLRRQTVEVLFVKNGIGTVLELHAPSDRWPEYGPTFEQIFQRFRP